MRACALLGPVVTVVTLATAPLLARAQTTVDAPASRPTAII
jgi:hypothetical protein